MLNTINYQNELGRRIPLADFISFYGPAHFRSTVQQDATSAIIIIRTTFISSVLPPAGPAPLLSPSSLTRFVRGPPTRPPSTTSCSWYSSQTRCKHLWGFASAPSSACSWRCYTLLFPFLFCQRCKATQIYFVAFTHAGWCLQLRWL